MDAVPLNHYSVLGLESTASAADIKKHWRRLAREHHPDVSKSIDADARMAALNMAHHVLSNPDRRAEYDSKFRASDRSSNQGHVRKTASDSGWSEGFEFTTSQSDIRKNDALFEQLFSESILRRHTPKQNFQRRETQATIELNLRDAYEGVSKSVSVNVAPTNASNPTASGQRLQVTIPKGVFEGQKIRLAGRGELGTVGSDDGDLLLSVKFKPDQHWRTMGRDVFGGPVLLTPWEAALGVKTKVHTPTGDAEVEIPPRWKPGRTLRLKGRGIPGGTANTSAGDLYLELAVVLPPADGAAACEAYAAMARAFPSFAPRAS